MEHQTLHDRLQALGQKIHAAEEKLREALAIKETPGLRYHVAYCQEQQGKLVEALVDYDRADELIQHGAAAADVAELIGPARDSLRERVPTLTVSVPKDVTGASLEVDGQRVAPAVAQATGTFSSSAHSSSV